MKRAFRNAVWYAIAAWAVVIFLGWGSVSWASSSTNSDSTTCRGIFEKRGVPRTSDQAIMFMKEIVLEHRFSGSELREVHRRVVGTFRDSIKSEARSVGAWPELMDTWLDKMYPIESSHPLLQSEETFRISCERTAPEVVINRSATMSTKPLCGKLAEAREKIVNSVVVIPITLKALEICAGHHDEAVRRDANAMIGDIRKRFKLEGATKSGAVARGESGSD